MIRSSEQTTSRDPAGTGLEAADGGRMWVDRQFRPALGQAGLDRFRSVMDTRTGHCMRALADRENWRLEIHGPHGQAQGVFLKKHHDRTWLGRLRARLGLGPGQTAARAEARCVQSLADDGIDVMRLVAYGEHLRADGLLESFVLTEELAGFTQLDHFLHRRFGPLDSEKTAADRADLSRLIAQVADVARRFHEAGYNHRDLYCCHFFIREPAPGRFEVKLIDLQRVQRRRRLRHRWIVKDLAQLAYSAPRDRITCSQKMAFARRYFGVAKLQARHKRLLRAVLAKQQLMEQKQGILP